MAKLELTNRSSQPFEYRGDSPDAPAFNVTTEVRKHLRWVTFPLVGCGTGIGSMTLPPGESTIVTVPVSNRDRETVYRRVRIIIAEAHGAYVVRSEPFTTPD